MPWESWPLWWVAGSPRSPEPVQEPWAPSQFPERRRKRLPSASTMYRPRVESGAAHAPASAAAPGRRYGRGSGGVRRRGGDREQEEAGKQVTGHP